jgi:hypothetical protein
MRFPCLPRKAWGWGTAMAVEGEVTLAMRPRAPSVSRELQFARSAPTLSLAPPSSTGEDGTTGDINSPAA